MVDALDEPIEFQPAIHRCENRAIGGLQADLQKLEISFLEEPRQFFIDEFGPYFGVEADLSMVVPSYEIADLLCACRVEVKDWIHEIDLGDLLLEPEQDLFLDPLDIETSIPYREIF